MRWCGLYKHIVHLAAKKNLPEICKCFKPFFHEICKSLTPTEHFFEICKSFHYTENFLDFLKSFQ